MPDVVSPSASAAPRTEAPETCGCAACRAVREHRLALSCCPRGLMHGWNCACAGWTNPIPSPSADTGGAAETAYEKVIGSLRKDGFTTCAYAVEQYVASLRSRLAESETDAARWRSRAKYLLSEGPDGVPAYIATLDGCAYHTIGVPGVYASTWAAMDAAIAALTPPEPT